MPPTDTTAENTEEDEQGTPDNPGKYDRFKRLDKAEYDRVNDLLRDRTTITAREWAIARICADFRTDTGVPMTSVGENLPELIPFMTDEYSPQAVNEAKKSYEDKVRMALTTALYGAMSGFYTEEGLNDLFYEATETAKFLLEVEGADVSVETERDVEERIKESMREVHVASKDLREELEDV